jgi:RNA polymerase sigma factor (sigma-70 family)
LIDAYDTNRLPLVRLAFLMTGDREAAEDIVQEAFLATRQLWSGVHDLKPYLRAAVVNRSRSWLRRKRLERRDPVRVELSYDAAPDEMWDALAVLAPRQRVAVVLRFYEGLPDSEIGSILGCREGTVRTTIHRALAALRKEISS